MLITPVSRPNQADTECLWTHARRVVLVSPEIFAGSKQTGDRTGFVYEPRKWPVKTPPRMCKARKCVAFEAVPKHYFPDECAHSEVDF